ITISTAAMTVDITKSPVRITVEDHAGQALLTEPNGGGVYAGGLRFQSTAEGPFFGIAATAIPGQNMDSRQDIRMGVVRVGGKVRAGQQGDGGAPLIYTMKYGLLVDSDGGNFRIDQDAGSLE